MNPYMLALFAAPREGGAAPGLVFAIQLAAIIAIFYFLLVRPQRKLQQRHREMVAALKKGDEVMTEGGLIGEVVHVADDRLTIRTGESRIVVARSKVQRVFNEPPAQS